MLSKPGILKEEPLQDSYELTRSDNDIPSVDLHNNDSNGGRKSPLAAMRNIV